MVYRVYSEKKKHLAHEAAALLADLRGFLGVESLRDLRILNRYDVENIDERLFEYGKTAVFSEPQLDDVYDTLPAGGDERFAVEFLPGQFDQRADSAAQCLQIISRGERPVVRTAKVYLLYGDITGEQLEHIKRYVINPVEAREASLGEVTTLAATVTLPADTEALEGFLELRGGALGEFVSRYSLALDEDDIAFCRDYFKSEGRAPTLTEIRMIDTYWSDHCRHTTFLTELESVEFHDEASRTAYSRYLAVRERLASKKPVCLMDLATVAAKDLKSRGLLPGLDQSDEINACTVKTEVEVDGKKQPYLLLFKNETHNHPTEIEPFGGAATCIGGAIRDPLSGRAYVYGAMRVTGAADPLTPLSVTLPGKLPQRKIVTEAALGYSSYGNQIGLATGIVDEIYHPGYAAKRMEIGAVIGAVPAGNVRRETPVPGDKVILLGGRTGRDGCGGATGSSKSHNAHSLETCGAEVQKGNAPEERKLQRLFRNKEASLLIKRCNDFGAGGVSVAIGELADGLEIDLDAVPKKYEGLNGTELAISESQERMAVVVAPEDVERFLALADGENLEATVVAEVKSEPRLVMKWRGSDVVNISRDFLDSNGATKRTGVSVAAPRGYAKPVPTDFAAGIKALAGDLNVCSRRGLAERFDSTIGAGTVLMPFGGKYQLTPIQSMVQKIPVERGASDDCTFMAWGYNPFVTERNPYQGAYLAVVESVAKLVASGARFRDVYLTFQEYFPRPGHEPSRWGPPFAALLGAFAAQEDLGVAAIGGKDSMSGTFEDLDVPPTLVSFAVTTGRAADAVSPEFKGAGHTVLLLSPRYTPEGLPDAGSLKAAFSAVTRLMREGRAVAAYTPGYGGVAEAVLKMSLGNGIGFAFSDDLPLNTLFGYSYGSFVLELEGAEECESLSRDSEGDFSCRVLGRTISEPVLSYGSETVPLPDLSALYEDKLEPVYPTRAAAAPAKVENFSFEATTRAAPALAVAKPLAVIPVFPGTNCEYDSARALLEAGANAETLVLNNLTPSGVERSVEKFAALINRAQMIFIPGGFSGGDEPDGSGKFINAFFRAPAVRDAVTRLLDERDGLILGICNGFQALIKLGLVPFGQIIDTDETCPTLTYNTIGRHQSRIVRTRVASNMSPWLAETRVGEVYSVPISHGEGRFVASEETVRRLAENGQIATQYADLAGDASADIAFNPNGSAYAVEGITSPDGRVLGKMGHCERIGQNLYKNVPGEYDMGLFRSGVRYFKKI